MARYRMSDSTVIDTANATASWRDSDGRTELYRSRRGRYYVAHTMQWKGSQHAPRVFCEWISDHEAVRWLLANEHKIPAELLPLVEDVSE
jgi:hypothetical protein